METGTSFADEILKVLRGLNNQGHSEESITEKNLIIMRETIKFENEHPEEALHYRVNAEMLLTEIEEAFDNDFPLSKRIMTLVLKMRQARKRLKDCDPAGVECHVNSAKRQIEEICECASCEKKRQAKKENGCQAH